MQKIWPVESGTVVYLNADGTATGCYSVPTVQAPVPLEAAEPRRIISSTFSMTFQMTPGQMWDLQCMLRGWKTTFTPRPGWNRRIQEQGRSCR
jgi:hypothetical protein